MHCFSIYFAVTAKSICVSEVCFTRMPPGAYLYLGLVLFVVIVGFALSKLAGLL